MKSIIVDYVFSYTFTLIVKNRWLYYRGDDDYDCDNDDDDGMMIMVMIVMILRMMIRRKMIMTMVMLTTGWWKGGGGGGGRLRILRIRIITNLVNSGKFVSVPGFHIHASVSHIVFNIFSPCLHFPSWIDIDGALELWLCEVLWKEIWKRWKITEDMNVQ